MFPLLNSKQRAFLRSKANSEEPVLHLGKGGLSEPLLRQAEDALAARELIKGKVLETAPFSSREAAEQVAQAVCAEVVQVIGTKFVLYRESHSKPREKRIQLVKPSKKRQA